MNIWRFGPVKDTYKTYADGTTVPGREQILYLNGQAVGEIEIHMHRRLGPDKVVDVSFGITAIMYGPPNPKDRADHW